MQIKTFAVILALLGFALAAPSPTTDIARTFGRRSLTGRDWPSKEEKERRCAEIKETCDCSRLPEDDIEA